MIDDLVGAGKIPSKESGERTEYFYADTGAMYRAMAYHISCKGISPEDEGKISLVNVKCRNFHRSSERETAGDLKRRECDCLYMKRRSGNMASATSKLIRKSAKVCGTSKGTLAKKSNVIMDGGILEPVCFRMRR